MRPPPKMARLKDDSVRFGWIWMDWRWPSSPNCMFWCYECVVIAPKFEFLSLIFHHFFWERSHGWVYGWWLAATKWGWGGGAERWASLTLGYLEIVRMGLCHPVLIIGNGSWFLFVIYHQWICLLVWPSKPPCFFLGHSHRVHSLHETTGGCWVRAPRLWRRELLDRGHSSNGTRCIAFSSQGMVSTCP